jgi:hypothetical protein
MGVLAAPERRAAQTSDGTTAGNYPHCSGRAAFLVLSKTTSDIRSRLDLPASSPDPSFARQLSDQ